MMEEVEIVGYGVFESTDGEVFVGYYEKSKSGLTLDEQYDIEEDNFYETELEAAYAAIEILNSKVKNNA